MPQKLQPLVGTPDNDVLTGTSRKNRIFGREGDDTIATKAGNYRAWGQQGRDRFLTLDGAPGHMEIMDLEMGDSIVFCGCPATRIEQRGGDAWIIKGSDVKAVAIGINASDLEINTSTQIISLVTDPLS